MKVILLDKSREQQAEILISSFRGNLIQGIITANSFDLELKKKIAQFENIVNTVQLSVLDEVAEKLDAYEWEICDKNWTIFDFQVFNEVDISFRIKELNNSVEEKERYSKLEKLGYDNRWLIYNYLTNEELNAQYLLYHTAVTEPDSLAAENGCQHTEHLRYRQFWKIAEGQNSFTNKELKELIELVECDEDQVMAKSFYHDILNKKKVTIEQIEEHKVLRDCR